MTAPGGAGFTPAHVTVIIAHPVGRGFPPPMNGAPANSKKNATFSLPHLKCDKDFVAELRRLSNSEFEVHPFVKNPDCFNGFWFGLPVEKNVFAHPKST